MTVFAASTVPRAEPLICAKCLRPIERGQLHRVAPERVHIACDPPPRLDVQRIMAAARAR